MRIRVEPHVKAFKSSLGENDGTEQSSRSVGGDAPQAPANMLFRLRLGAPSENDRVIAIVAPSGYGKTTLALQWLEESSKSATTGWLQADEASRDAVVFLRKLDDAMAVGGRREGNTFYGAEDLEAAIDTWVSEIRARRSRQVLFVDDAHLLEGSSALRCFHWLIASLPRNLVLIITSRNADGLGLATLALRGEVRWVTVAQLALNHEEIAALGKKNGLELDSTEIETIAELTEGWPALTQLALVGVSAENGTILVAETRLGAPLASYIHDQFLATLSANERLIVSIMAILGEATPELLESLTASPVGDELRRFERMGAIRQHTRRGKPVLCVMHPMIREEIVTRDRLDAERRRSIQRSAASWLWGHGEPERAIRLALAGEMSSELGDWLRHYTPILVYREGRHETFLTLLAAAEQLWGKRDVELSSWAVSALMFLRRYPDAERLLSELPGAQASVCDQRDKPSGASDPADLQRAVIAGLCDDYIAAGKFAKNWIARGGGDFFHQGMAWIAVAFSQKCQCQFAEVGRSLEKARTLMQRADSAYGIAWARVVGIASLLKEGRFREVLAETAAAELELRDYRAGVVDLVALMKATSSLASYERGDFEQCQAALESAMPRLHRQGIVDAMIAGYVAAARLQVARGQLSAGLDVLAEGQRVGTDRGLSRLCITLEFERAMMLAKHGAASKVHMPEQAATPHPGTAMDGLMRDKFGRLSVRLALVHGGADAIDEALGNALARARKTGQRYKLAELLVFDALRLHSLGRMAGALASLTESLEIGLAEGYLRLYVDEGEPLAILLRALAKCGTLPVPVADFVRRLLQEHPSEASPSANLASEPLSERELEILALVDEGMSNREISQQLFLTEGTVKWHLHNLYAKLNVRSRTAALHAAKTAGLLV